MLSSRDSLYILASRFVCVKHFLKFLFVIRLRWIFVSVSLAATVAYFNRRSRTCQAPFSTFQKNSQSNSGYPEGCHRKHSTPKLEDSKILPLRSTKPSAIAEFSFMKTQRCQRVPRRDTPSTSKDWDFDSSRPLRMASVAGPHGHWPISVSR